jgi:hypothetical protein
VRILGEVKKEYADLLRRADAIFIEELRNFKDEATGKTWYDLTSQAFTVFLPVKSVGVMGDGRTYDYVVALRAVQTSDFMTADWAELPYALLKKVSGRIINEVRGINRVTYDVSSKPPATIEWESSLCNTPRSNVSKAMTMPINTSHIQAGVPTRSVSRNATNASMVVNLSCRNGKKMRLRTREACRCTTGLGRLGHGRGAVRSGLMRASSQEGGAGCAGADPAALE